MKDKEIQKKIKNGAILAQVSFELIGNPKEYIEKALKGYMDNIRKDSQITILSEEYGEPEETEGNLWGTFADAEMLFDNPKRFIWLCINFMPANVEIIAPEKLTFSDKNFGDWINDLLAKLHEVSHTVRQSKMNNDIVTKSMNALIQNSILLASENYHTSAEISKKTGIQAKQLEPFFESLIKQGKLEKKKNKYYKKGKSKK